MFGSSGFSVVTFASAPGFIYGVSVQADASALDINAASISVNSAVLDTTSAQDGPFTVSSVLSVSMTEQATADDSTAASFSVNSAVIELGSGVSSFDADIDFAVSVTESGAVSQTVDVSVDFAVSVTGTVEVVDQTAVSFIVLTDIVETVEPQDVLITAGSILNASVTDDATGSETFDAAITFEVRTRTLVFGYERYFADMDFAVRVDENTQASDNIPASITVLTAVQEGVEAGDTFIARYLWETINTFETEQWNTIRTAEVELLVTTGGGFASGAFSSGPFTGLGGVTSILPVEDIWSVKDVSQPDTWNLVRTVD